jgi:hypothetical protein
MEGLSFKDKEKLPEMDLTDRQHRRYITSFYESRHGGSGAWLGFFTFLSEEQQIAVFA